MEKTWRWFGEKDPITLDMLRQIGVEGIVTALHQVPNGEIWTSEAIMQVKSNIEAHGLKWSVVESLPVPEPVKYAGPGREQLIANYKVSLANLGKAGIKTVVYNFMPVIDWIRTDLNYKLADGTSTLYFDKVRFAYFDCYILNREGAIGDYSEELMKQVNALRETITPDEIEALVTTIIVKTQGFVNENFKGNVSRPVELFRELLARYKGVDKNQLRANLKYFLEEVVPVAGQYGIKLCVHPDDPPYPVLGLPRIVGNEEDIAWVLNAVDSPSNGFTFCAGSLSSGLHNDVLSLALRFADKTHFLHLRSTEVYADGNFLEAPHDQGRGYLVELIRIFEKLHPGLPMRVDHGKLMLDDAQKNYNPGYSFTGRMYALAQISGMLAVVNYTKK
ncbi:MAG: mannonate dehydratase [Paludibacter sp.]|jgi:mannonate dehydratase|nr:mannonate dehydratase [Paludibacter sp.]